MKRNSATALPALPITVLDLHDAIRKVTFVHVEVQAVHRDKLSESYIISLFVRVCQIIAEHKTSLFACMGMEVYEHQEVFRLLHYRLFGGPNCRMVLFARVKIKPVEVIRHGVQAIVPAWAPIRVEDRDYFENEVLSQEPALLIFKISEQIKKTIQHETTWCLTGMHPRRQEYNRFFFAELHRSRLGELLCIGIEALGIFRDSLSFGCYVVRRWYRQQL